MVMAWKSWQRGRRGVSCSLADPDRAGHRGPGDAEQRLRTHRLRLFGTRTCRRPLVGGLRRRSPYVPPVAAGTPGRRRLDAQVAATVAIAAALAFDVHLAVSTEDPVVLLVTINLIVVPEFLWFFFPVTGMGLGVAAHAWFSRDERRG